jgi:menaquinone-dependent protoporphyrinogen oxidase
MTVPVLIAYATKHGSTREVAEALAEILGERGFSVEVKPATEVADIGGYGAVVVGGALYTGRLHADARRFLNAHRRALAELPLAVFAMGPRTLAEEDMTSSRRQLDSALEKVPELHPVSIAVFGGVLDPSQHHFPINRIPASDARNWDAIRAWAEGVAGAFSG